MHEVGRRRRGGLIAGIRRARSGQHAGAYLGATPLEELFAVVATTGVSGERRIGPPSPGPLRTVNGGAKGELETARGRWGLVARRGREPGALWEERTAGL